MNKIPIEILFFEKDKNRFSISDSRLFQAGIWSNDVFEPKDKKTYWIKPEYIVFNSQSKKEVPFRLNSENKFNLNQNPIIDESGLYFKDNKLFLSIFENRTFNLKLLIFNK